MSARGRRGADAVARTLARTGVRRVFALSGNHVMPVFDALLDTGIALVHARHEAAAVHMADAWARLTGEPGVALVTGGPGHANAISALYTAAMAESPVVLLSGHAPSGEQGLGAFQEMRQASVAAPLAKASWTSADAGVVAWDVSRALRLSLSGRPGPVHLSLPTDALEDEAAGEDDPPVEDARPEAIPLGESRAEAVVERLMGAHRPLILCGPTLMTRDGHERTAALEEATGVPVVGMESPRGIADPSLGAFAEMLPAADVVLLLGKRLDFSLKFARAPAFSMVCEFLQLDAEAPERERARRAVGPRLVASTRADAWSAIDALIRAAQRRAPMTGAWRNEVRSAIAYRPPEWESAAASAPGRLHPVQVCRPMQAILDASPDSVLVVDGGEFGQWAQACLAAPHRVINGMAGSIGAALPFAVAAGLARPGAPVVALMGDGTFGFHPAELDTAVRCGSSFLAVVGNDARWNAEYQIQLRNYGRERAVGCELLPARYDQVAVGFGAYGERVTEARELLPAARRAMESGRPACLDVLIEGLAAPDVRRPG
ncbi:MAG TPA: thiamine pyrophosphate-binding protein [Usitatibacter sp.]|nr:thiamine pyrophosphate-binding protein [Usitatibacter sp.]